MASTPKIKLTENLVVAKIGIGTWGIGGYMKRSPYNDDQNDINQIRYQLECGLTLVDSWLAQAEGHTNKIIAQAISGIPRDSFQIVAKLDVKNFKIREDVENTVNQYLTTLGIDYIDILQIHKPQWDGLNSSDTLSEMDRMVKIGKARYLAISNTNAEQLTSLISQTKNQFLFNEINFSVIDRSYQTDGTIDFCLKNNIKIIAYKPLARGMTNYLSGVSGDPLFKDLSAKYDRTTNQIALNWLLSKENFLAWVKSVNRSHINENLDSLSFQMDPTDHQKIDNWKFA